MDDAAPMPGEQQITAAAGSVFVQDSRNWHSAPHNVSEDARISVIDRAVRAGLDVGRVWAVARCGLLWVQHSMAAACLLAGDVS
jgi:ectoine hydroxylase-related dioxygenase (phytanoyl-CoA dioxygenase family)